MKNNRQKEILEIISETSVETQGELISLLRKRGYNVTQATVSRDIKELRLIKSSDDKSKYRYAQGVQEETKHSIKYGSMLSEIITRADVSGTVVVVRTHTGMAMAAATSIDSLGWEEILGTIAGDDTIFVAVSTPELAVSLAKKLTEVIRKDKNT